jgi:4-hydroxy-3-methylbut-2-enyl diphosphate reductase IspH
MWSMASRPKGAVFVEDLDEVPDGATVIFSAHGVPQAVRIAAAERGLNVFDATCPLVTKVHLEVARLHKQGYEIVMIGHKGHPRSKAPWARRPARCTWWRAWRMSHYWKSAAAVRRRWPTSRRPPCRWMTRG